MFVMMGWFDTEYDKNNVYGKKNKRALAVTVEIGDQDRPVRTEVGVGEMGLCGKNIQALKTTCEVYVAMLGMKFFITILTTNKKIKLFL